MKQYMLAAIIAAGLTACAGTPSPKRDAAVYVPPSAVATTPPPAAVDDVPTPQPAVTVEQTHSDVVAQASPPPKIIDEAPPKQKPVRAPSPPPAIVQPAKAAPVVADKKPPATVTEGNTLKGHIDLVVGADQTVGAGEVADTVVYFLPNGATVHPKPGQFQIYTRDKQFDPSSLVVPVGSTVSFPNQDQIIHNVFSASVGEEFDLGLYGEGGTASHTFKKPGLVFINCNVHQAMQANILVVDTPYFTHPSRSGDFTLTGVPSGDGKLVIWHPRAMNIERTIAVPSADAKWSVVITKPRVSGHLNKEHKTYKLDVTQK